MANLQGVSIPSDAMLCSLPIQYHGPIHDLFRNMLRPSNKYRRNYVAAATEPQIQDLKTIISTIAALVAATISAAATMAVVVIV